MNWIGESIAEAIGEALAEEGISRVSSDERRAAVSAMGLLPAARLTQATLVEIAISVDAGVLVYGDFAVQSSNVGQRTLTASATVLDIRRMRRMARLDSAGQLEDLSRIQSRLAWGLLGALQPSFAQSEESYLSSRPTNRLDAMENYIRGLSAPNREQQVRYFSTASRLAPSYSEPNLRLGLFQIERKDYRAAAGWLAKVGAGATRFREASFYLALCRYHLGEFEQARAGLSTLAGHAPLSEVLNNLGVVQSRLGLEDATGSFDRAIEADPADPAAYFNAGYYLWKKGRFEDARRRLEASLDRAPDDEDAKILLVRCEERIGPQPGDPRTERLERLKDRYDESGWLMLKQIFTPKPTAH